MLVALHGLMQVQTNRSTSAMAMAFRHPSICICSSPVAMTSTPMQSNTMLANYTFHGLQTIRLLTSFIQRIQSEWQACQSRSPRQ